MPLSLEGSVCIVTGATRGIGKGIALQLGAAGATVYITGRTVNPTRDDPIGGSLKETAEEVENRGGTCIPVQCDHSKDDDVEQLFKRLADEQNGRLDLLVNNAYTAVKAIADVPAKKGLGVVSRLCYRVNVGIPGEIMTDVKAKALGENIDVPFWEQPISMWDTVNNVGLRNNYLCSVYAARLMTPRRNGLIINVSSIGGITYVFNPVYGIGKEAKDRMAADCAVELRKSNVAYVSLWPGAVRTENIIYLTKSNKFDLEKLTPSSEAKVGSNDTFLNGESPEYVGKSVVSLATDPNIMDKSGKILMTADLGYEYGFKDVDGKDPQNYRQLKLILWRTLKNKWISNFIPSFIYIPKWMLHFKSNKF